MRHLWLWALLSIACGQGPPEPPETPPREPPRPAVPGAPVQAPTTTPHVRFEAPSTEPSYDASALIAAVRARGLFIRRCFENLSVHDNVPPGRVVVSFTVNTDGAIVDARTLEGGTYGDCVGEEIGRVHLARGPDEPVVVFFPIVFEPGT